MRYIAYGGLRVFKRNSLGSHVRRTCDPKKESVPGRGEQGLIDHAGVQPLPCLRLQPGVSKKKLSIEGEAAASPRLA